MQKLRTCVCYNKNVEVLLTKKYLRITNICHSNWSIFFPTKPGKKKFQEKYFTTTVRKIFTCSKSTKKILEKRYCSKLLQPYYDVSMYVGPSMYWPFIMNFVIHGCFKYTYALLLSFDKLTSICFSKFFFKSFDFLPTLMTVN